MLRFSGSQILRLFPPYQAVVATLVRQPIVMLRRDFSCDDILLVDIWMRGAWGLHARILDFLLVNYDAVPILVNPLPRLLTDGLAPLHFFPNQLFRCVFSESFILNLTFHGCTSFQITRAKFHSGLTVNGRYS